MLLCRYIIYQGQCPGKCSFLQNVGVLGEKIMVGSLVIQYLSTHSLRDWVTSLAPFPLWICFIHSLVWDLQRDQRATLFRGGFLSSTCIDQEVLSTCVCTSSLLSVISSFLQRIYVCVCVTVKTTCTCSNQLNGNSSSSLWSSNL